MSGPQRCLLCNENGSEALFKSTLHTYDGYELTLTLVQCRTCGLVYASPLPTQDQIQRYFCDGQKYTRWQNAEFARRQREGVFRWGLAQIDALSPHHGRLLDVGSGYGHFMALARIEGWETFGVEISAAGCQYAEEQLHLSNVHQGSLRHAAFPDGYFDVVTFWDVLYYCTDPLTELQEAVRILTQDGVVCVRVSNSLYIRAYAQVARLIYRRLPRVRAHSRAWHPGDGLYYFSPKTINGLLEKAGFRAVSATPSPRNRIANVSPEQVIRAALGLEMRVAARAAILGSRGKINLFPSIAGFGHK